MDGEEQNNAQAQQEQQDNVEANQENTEANHNGENQDGSGENQDNTQGEGQDQQNAEGGEGDQESGEKTQEQQPVTEQVTVQASTDVSQDQRIHWMLEHLKEHLEGFDFDGMWQNDHYSWMLDFLDMEKTSQLYFWIERSDNKLMISNSGCPKFYDSGIKAEDYNICFFLKREVDTMITAEGIEDQVQFSTLEGDPLDDLLNKMVSDQMPNLLGENSWPEGVRKDFIANLHRFMASLTEASHLQRGRTFLYIPTEDLTDIEACVKDKDLIQRLEFIVIKWTQQIKELVSNQDSPSNHDISSPLDEISYWNERNANLNVLNKRLLNNDLLKIIKVLDASSSSYLPGFLDLKQKIEAGNEEAKNNLQFLNTLSEPCTRIEKATPKEIPKILPDVLQSVRIIYELSKYYHTNERMKGLLTKISNQIIKRCRAQISIDDMLDGDVEKCMRDLDESINCCKEWKAICTRMQNQIKKYSTKKDQWTLNKDETIFAENEGFIQRCKDLKEICEGQLQFARKGANCVMPVFGGRRGPEITQNLLELEEKFKISLQAIRNLDYKILDVKITKWHDDYGQVFKDQIKNIEIMYYNTTTLAFNSMSTVQDAVEMLESFDSIAKRPLIKEFVHKKSADKVYKIFTDEIKEVEELFERESKKLPPMPVSHPKTGGLAIWAYSLICRIDKAREALNSLYFIPTHPHAAEALEKHEKLRVSLDNFIANTQFSIWKQTIDAMDTKNIDEKLDNYILVRQDGKEELPGSISTNPLFQKSKKTGTLMSNFDKDLYKVLIEVSYWTKIQTLGFVTIQHSVARLTGRKEQLRILKENVMLIVRDYNNIMHTIDNNEKLLFKEHLDQLDKVIEPGIRRLNWGQPADHFVFSCRKQCLDVFRNIQTFQDNHEKINNQLEKLSSSTLTNIKKDLYLLKEFIRQQEACLDDQEENFKESFNIIKVKMMDTYDLFIHRGQGIQGEWLEFIKRLDNKLEKALKQAVKNTLVELSKHIRGDLRQETVPIFKVYTILDPNESQWKIIHDPSHDELKQSIQEFIKKIIKITKVIPRIERIFRNEREAIIAQFKKELDEAEKSGGGGGGLFGRGGMRNPTDVNYQNLTQEEKEIEWKRRWELPKIQEPGREYFEKITKNKSILSNTDYIIEGVDKINMNIDEDRKFWQSSDDLRQLSNIRTERGKKRILRGNQDQLDVDPVQRYRESMDSLQDILNDIKNKPTQKPESFIIIDCSKLKQSLIDYGQDFIQQIFHHLAKESKEDLNSLLTEFVETVEELKQPTTKLDHLKKNRAKYYAVMQKKEQMKARIEPIKSKFNFIKENDQDIGLELNEEENQKLEGIDEAWTKFNDGLEEAKVIIDKYTTQLKTEMDNTIEDFKKEVKDNEKNFMNQAPYTVDGKSNDVNARAFEKLTEFAMITKELRDKEEENKFGLDIFGIEPQPYSEITKVEKQIALLREIWNIKAEWDDQWNEYKVIQFGKLQMGLMDDRAFEFFERLRDIDKEIKMWNVYEFLKQKIDVFRSTCPLIVSLRHESMRPRHWKELRFEVKEDFDEGGEDFTLEKIFELQLINHAEKIGDICANAEKQLTIETQLEDIKKTWTEDVATDLDIIKKKSRADNEEYYKINSTDNIIAIIEDHSVKLSTMKSSAYYRQFDDSIDLWESNIAQITETLELLTIVQGKWQYLESIFKGQPDISKQMPNESSVFTRINNVFKLEMERINKEKNCLRSLIVKDFLKVLNDLNEKLEHIEKNLDNFLQSKRKLFPRFYFLSNEDLLEIIGQSKDPNPIIKHIKKIFEGVHSLQVQPNGSKSNKTYEIEHLISSDGEHVDLNKPVLVEAKAEHWLDKLLKEMKEALKKYFYKFYSENIQTSKKINDRDKLMKTIKNSLGQILITMAQMAWTLEVNNALMQIETQSNSAFMKKARTNYKRKLEWYVELVEKPSLEQRDRNKLVALIIIDEHNRDIIEQLYAKKIQSPKDFEWVSQLRFKKQGDEHEKLAIVVEQTSCSFPYGYEYQGNNGRLVITPLTDRAYMTLTNALMMQRGGAPQGPAGTGKTETVKDLGKNLALFVIIQNCSDTLDYISLGKIFAGLALSGSWGCFDEFNRIQLEVLSVVAQTIQIILDAIRKDEALTQLNEQGIHVEKETGLFITMNPGYAGRSELPDNLASLFRPVAMMIPDFVTICKISLMSEGFKQNDVLAKKVFTIYDLMKKQLSKQDHYDFNMRAIKSVLNASGRIKRQLPEHDELTVMIKALRDMNLPKFIAEDVILFDNLFIDLFPGCEEPEADTDELQIEIENAMIAKGLYLNEATIVKVMQLYEYKKTRHGNMLVGLSMSGKTTAWEILNDALNVLHKKELEKDPSKKDKENSTMTYPAVKYELINPKSITIRELYGDFDEGQPPQWVDGILSSILKKICQESKNEQRWMILDGPVDTLWIESMNSVLDDSKLLTLNNGDRIALSPSVRLLFEVENLAVASPATVSRAGMIYVDIDELGWRPLMTQWIKSKEGAEYRELLQKLVEEYVPKVLSVKKTQCTELVPTNEASCVKNLCNLYDALCSNLTRLEDEEEEAFNEYIGKWFVFCLIWSIGATVDEASRKNIDYILRDINSIFPHSNTVFEHYINLEKHDFAPWDEKLPPNWKPNTTDFTQINVPTVDVVRNRFITNALLDKGSQINMVGHSGVGKTVLVERILQALDIHVHSFTINFSAGTTSQSVQDIIESNFERRAKNKYRPKNAKHKAICFIDDLNMPRKDTFGSQPPLELMRQWIDYEFWFDRAKITQNKIEDLQFLCAMGKPGGGRQEISNRLLSKFHVINYTIPSEANMKKIFETISSFKFKDFEEDIKNLSASFAIATINLFNIIQENFLPTPAKSHYVFNMRDISKVFQGVDMANQKFIEGREQMIKLWSHEVLRVFQDRLISYEDRDTFKGFLDEQLQQHFQCNYVEHCTTDGKDAVFVDFLNDNMQNIAVYEEVTDSDKLRTYLQDQLKNFNSTPKAKKMDLVLFADAITHVAKIYRVMRMKRGNAFLVGVGGSGRHSLSRLSAYMARMHILQLEVTKGFGLRGFREFIKDMYEIAAYRGKDKLDCLFIFSDNDVIEESFLEDIQNMLSGGIVPNMYTNDEMNKLREELRKPFKKAHKDQVETADALNDFFMNRIKQHVHLSICFSPIGDAFKNYCRMYPALINNTTIDWFMGWPEDALTEVALKFLHDLDGLPEDKIPGLARVASYAHTSTNKEAQNMQRELKRILYVTPTNFIELLKGYGKILKDRRQEIGSQITKLRNGLSKLDNARKEVEEMTVESESKRAEVSKQQKICEDLVISMTKEQRQADESQKRIEIEKVKIEKEKEQTEKLAQEAENELKKAEPALESAQKAIEGLDKKYIAEIKSFQQPPPDVSNVMNAVMICLDRDPTWVSAKKELTDPKFVERIMKYDKENINPKTLKKIEKFTKGDQFQPAYVQKISFAAGALCQWVRSIEDYAKALKIVAPKREKKAYAEAQLKKAIEYLNSLEAEFKVLADRLAELNELHAKTNNEMLAYKRELDNLQTKIDRGEKLVHGLSGEKARWQAQLITLDDNFLKLTGDCLLASSFMSYCGPFPSEFRENLCSSWKNMVEGEEISHDEHFDFSEFLAGAAQAREWQINGLPTDKFSTENGVLVTKGLRYGLNIDPQSQASNWIKRMEGDGLVIADYKDPNYMKKIEQSVQKGRKVLFLDVEEEIDPVLDNILQNSLIKVGSRHFVKVGDKEIEYNPNFKLYITTRIGNPHYTPEVSTKVTVINFSVKQSGLEDQCLGIVVKIEQPNLEKTKNEVVTKIAENKKIIINLENEILRLLQESNVNLLEDVHLINTLQSSKETSDEVKTALEQAELTMKRIDDTRETFRPCGRVASILFFVLNDLNKIDPMYQFSLDWYKKLFMQSISKSKEQMFQDRINSINKYHTLAVYKAACKSLFEKHKLLLSLQMCVMLKMSKGEIDENEWDFFLRGGQVYDRSTQVAKPQFDWITQTAWDNITELEKALPDTFTGISASVIGNPREWQRWFHSTRPEPENCPLPGEWETKCEERLKKMIVLRCFRVDRVIFAIKNYIEKEMKREFIEARPYNIEDIIEETPPTEPIIFVLSPGVDPTEQLQKLAEKNENTLSSISLGKGQSERAKKYLQDGCEKGNWVFLANCHLSLSLLPDLEGMLDDIYKNMAKSNDSASSSFKVFLSANSHPKFPISLLQRSQKVTREPPKGIKSNMLRLYDIMGSEFIPCDQEKNFRLAMFGLCWFHTILIERKKFKTLGWNVTYAFNDSDFLVCQDLIAAYLGRLKDGQTEMGYDRKAPIPWISLQILIADCNYGGRVTDDRDRRLIKVYAKDVFNEELVNSERWRPTGTEDLNYAYPIDESAIKNQEQAAYFTPVVFGEEILGKMESMDPPVAYGQHINAEISSQVTESNQLLESILSLQPQKAGGEGESAEAKVLRLVRELQEKVPEFIDIRALKYKLRNDESPLSVVLLQEIGRYNVLLKKLSRNLNQLEKGIQGLVLISPDLEEIIGSLYENKVPSAWSFAYFSLKPLANWFSDLNDRYKFFALWGQKGLPFSFWIGAFTYPTGFTTALLQKFSRKANGAPIDRLEFDFIPINKLHTEINEHPKEGSYIHNLYLEGAKWDVEKQVLKEPDVMELTTMMPVLHFKPIQKRSKQLPSMYTCPCYYYPHRAGSVTTDSWQFNVDIKCGEQGSEFWVKRGAALLMSTGQ